MVACTTSHASRDSPGTAPGTDYTLCIAIGPTARSHQADSLTICTAGARRRDEQLGRHHDQVIQEYSLSHSGAGHSLSHGLSIPHSNQMYKRHATSWASHSL